MIGCVSPISVGNNVVVANNWMITEGKRVCQAKKIKNMLVQL